MAVRFCSNIRVGKFIEFGPEGISTNIEAHMTFRVTRIDYDKKHVYCVVESIKLRSTRSGGVNISQRGFVVALYTNSRTNECWINHTTLKVGTSWTDVTSKISLEGMPSYPCTTNETRLGLVKDDGTGTIQIATRCSGKTQQKSSGNVPLTNAIYFNNNIVYDIYLNGTKVDNILYLNGTVVG